MKHRAFKFWLIQTIEESEVPDKTYGLAVVIYTLCSERHQNAFELMEEAGEIGTFTQESFMKAAQMVMNQVNQENHDSGKN